MIGCGGSRSGVDARLSLSTRNHMSQPDQYKDHKVPWEKADLFFLRDAVNRGMSYAKIAGFLGRTEAEVREKSRALKLSVRKQMA